jgi:hypothetical protein
LNCPATLAAFALGAQIRNDVPLANGIAPVPVNSEGIVPTDFVKEYAEERGAQTPMYQTSLVNGGADRLVMRIDFTVELPVELKSKFRKVGRPPFFM